MTSHNSTILPFMSSSELFKDLEEQDLEGLAASSKFVRSAPGSLIFSEGDSANGGFIVSSGRVILRKSTHKDRKIITQLLGPGDPFGVITAAQGQSYPLTAEAISESVCLRLDQDALVSKTGSNPIFQNYLLKMCSERMRHSHDLISRLADANSEARIAAAILMFGNKFGTIVEDGTLIDVTRQELASLAATTVETCIRITKSLEDNGVLKFPKLKTIVVSDHESLGMLCKYKAA